MKKILGNRRIRLFFLLFVALFLVLFLIQVLVPYFLIDISNTEDSGNSITFLSYNLENRFTNQTMQTLEEANADIIALQEFFVFYLDIQDNRAIIGENSYYYYNNTDYPQFTYGLMILSRWPMSRQQFVALPGNEGELARGFLDVDINTPNGEIQVINTHLQFPIYFAKRSEQVNIIIDYLSDLPSVALGDFNTPDSIYDPAYRKLASELNDGWIASGEESFNGNTWSSNRPVLRVDYLWFDNMWEIIRDSAQIFKEPEISDHCGLTIKAQIV